MAAETPAVDALAHHRRLRGGDVRFSAAVALSGVPEPWRVERVGVAGSRWPASPNGEAALALTASSERAAPVGICLARRA